MEEFILHTKKKNQKKPIVILYDIESLKSKEMSISFFCELLGGALEEKRLMH